MRTLLAVALALAIVGAAPASTTDLLDAARRGDATAIRSLVAAGADVNAVEGDGSTALLWVAHRETLDALEVLIRAGADVNRANDLGATPLWAAAQNGNLSAVDMLLAAGADPNTALLRGETSLMTAARAGYVQVVERLLAHGADPSVAATRDQTPLMWAAAQGHSEAVRLLVAAGADVNARSAEWMNYMAQGNATHPEHQDWFEHGGNTALMFAARRGDLQSARHLVSGGADVNALNAWGVSALSMAVQANFPELFISGPIRVAGQENFLHVFQDPAIVAFLLDAGADPNLGADRFTALPAAIMHRDTRSVDLLLASGADPDLPLGSWTPERRGSHFDFVFDRSWVGARPLWLAARFGTPEMIQSLLRHGADPNAFHRGERWNSGPGIFAARTEELTTPLMVAVRMSTLGSAWHSQVLDRDVEAETFRKVGLLLEAGVDVNALDSTGRTALDGARLLRYETVVRLLVDAGAKAGSEVQGSGGR